jgi:NAD(P)-dependent dehydrogenase (short-subunit alcohol dehydrogenase family)
MTRSLFLTGGTSGIGLKLASLLISAGYHIVSIGRRLPPIAAGSSGLITQLDADLAEDGYASRLSSWLDAHGERFDFVGFIHCAGRGDTRPILDTTIDSISEQVKVNLLSAILIAKLVLPYLNKIDSRVYFLGSRARRFPFLGGSAYCASKAGLHALSDCLALEARQLGWNIGITIFEFGTVATGFAGVPKGPTQISELGASEFIMESLRRPLDDFVPRVVEVVPSVKRLLNA